MEGANTNFRKTEEEISILLNVEFNCNRILKTLKYIKQTATGKNPEFLKHWILTFAVESEELVKSMDSYKKTL